VALEKQAASAISPIDNYALDALSKAFLIIPRLLIQNSGADALSVLMDLQTKHRLNPGCKWGIDGIRGCLAEMVPNSGVWEATSVKLQTFKSAIEAACMILRVDDILSGLGNTSKQQQPELEEQPEL
jgi:T-complex protein 1 subunit gamma